MFRLKRNQCHTVALVTPGFLERHIYADTGNAPDENLRGLVEAWSERLVHLQHGAGIQHIEDLERWHQFNAAYTEGSLEVDVELIPAVDELRLRRHQVHGHRLGTAARKQRSRHDPV